MKTTALCCFASLAVLAMSCGSRHADGDGAFPADFNSLSDAGRVAYMMDRASADSVARFICRAALGQVKGARIDTLATATLYAYENYRDTALMNFADEYDRYVERLPLPDKMRLYVMAGTEDPQGLGYQLGLEYVAQIRDRKMTGDQVQEEIAAFRTACGADSLTYRRFLKGFQTVLKVDRGKDLPDEIYRRFID